MRGRLLAGVVLGCGVCDAAPGGLDHQVRTPTLPSALSRNARPSKRADPERVRMKIDAMQCARSLRMAPWLRVIPIPVICSNWYRHLVLLLTCFTLFCAAHFPVKS